jgi:DNA-binding LacI/PurR family transcriptional regulator
VKISRPETLVDQTVRAIREAIRKGEIGPLLPGEPRMAKWIGVSRRTLRSALDILAREGVLSPTTRGRRREVLAETPVHPENARSGKVGIFLPGPFDLLGSGMRNFLRDLRKLLEGDGATHFCHHLESRELKLAPRKLEALLAEQQADIWFLVQPSLETVEFFRMSGRPAVIVGGPATDMGFPYCAYDGAATLRHAVGVLARAGHTRIMAPFCFPNPLGVETIREEFEKRGLGFNQSLHAPFWNNDPETFGKLLRTRLGAADRPTAIILTGITAFIVLYSTLLECGLSIPQDISVISADSDPMLAYFRPSLTHYATPYHPLALVAARMIRVRLRTPGAPPETKLLFTEYVRGESVAPPSSLPRRKETSLS